MRVVRTIDEVRAAVREQRRQGHRIGLVPTMGALHEGHLSLVRLARGHADRVVLSIFVNPTQFGPGEDLEAYPRTLEADCEAARSAGVDVVFAPSVEEIYPDGHATVVRVERLSGPLCGRHRPGHFDGVALVVTKLLNIVRPDVSVFGQKDAQQAILIRRLAADLHLPGEIVIGPTVREEGGLAVSSRNRYLSPEERRSALALSRGLFRAEASWEAGERRGEALVATARAELEAEPRIRPDYVEIRDLETLEAWTDPERPALLAVAARVGAARLIDNVFLGAAVADAPRPRRAGEEHGLTDRNGRTKPGMAIVLAAGEGKRMQSDLPKVLHEVAGLPLLAHVGRAARESGVDRIVAVIGKGADEVRRRFDGEGWEFVEQTERLGTGDAVRRAKAALESFEGDVLVLAGDVPLLKGETLRRLREAHRAESAAVTVLTARLPDATGYGRIVRDENGVFVGIVEHKDATEAQRAVDEVNSSIYCFDAAKLRSVLWRIGSDNAQNEIYLTDAVGLLHGDGEKVCALAAAAPEEILGVNTREQLGEIEELLRGSEAARESR